MGWKRVRTTFSIGLARCKVGGGLAAMRSFPCHAWHACSRQGRGQTVISLPSSSYERRFLLCFRSPFNVRRYFACVRKGTSSLKRSWFGGYNGGGGREMKWIC
ncbi:hypothetical protein NPIL_36731 [Nephila pilipes]|uniref:Uncharacterized protein n=1 Tax=Nephila pilipes TaxID=299642 RepID=A0A8X6NTA1_NEPPI|nr:hypothetical protein NPIL_36731 [Nephila pilipes]